MKLQMMAAVLTSTMLVLTLGAVSLPPAAASCSASDSSGQGAHAYFARLAARPECVAAYSLRDTGQLAKYRHGPKALGQRVTYEPEKDNDPRRQDAAKIVVPAGEPSLRATVRLPIGTSDGTTTLVTWDAWFGSEFRFEKTGINNYKNFQFASPDRTWFEVKTRFARVESREARRAMRTPNPKRGGRRNQSEPAQPAPETARPNASPGADGQHHEIGEVDARAYMKVGPNVTNRGSVAPKAGSFTIRGETWTRYWVLIEQRGDDWDPVSLWVADENNNPVQILDKRLLSVNGSVNTFWLEYNTSTNARQGLPERVAYARNVVVLRNVKDVAPLLERPTSAGK
jgi:hypothetical protein